ncbi:irregular chiasm C-roughest protein-like isoform X1 [Macrosteles quadrilineatus]|uniref:irregular chiasm C-roughest protein-like isoform X1 n=1 Tax=Macrosteles quadrilineatus TaxID=74068 RepID=UPI0023E26823|nr:irregular chiasm C-roughest protein-like isoform X1 [Macrosteles quadrilineatus]
MKPTGAAVIALVNLFYLIKDAATLQKFDKQPHYSEVNPGEDIRLDCKIFNKRGTCSWQKDNKPVGIYLKKYEWAGNQESGDCSLWIRAATLEFDDGEWECQVTASDFTTQDALTSSPVRLVVRVQPQRPRIEHRSNVVLPGHNVTVKSGDKATVKCLSKYGNPPAKLMWFLGEVDVTNMSSQSNSPEIDNPRTWVASSVLEISLDKDHHQRSLRCVAVHESYPAKSQSAEVRLDITYPPETRLVGTPGSDVEEGVDTVVLRCVTDANPPATITWRRSDRQEVVSAEESLQFRPVTRRDSGTYTCQASNKWGSSDPLTVQLDVKYAPVVKSVGPDRLTTASLYSQALFNCEAESHPPPQYQWLQKLSATASQDAMVRGSERQLLLRNVTYDHQGEYVCRVVNFIGGKERMTQSEAVSLQVVGAPQILREGGDDALVEVVMMRGQTAVLRQVVCADPRPRRLMWEWGSLQLSAGQGLGRYHAEDLIQDEREDCYEARLVIQDVEPADSRNYFMFVENDRGNDRHSVRLAVREPIAMTTLISLAGACFVVFLLCILCAVYCVRAEKCCFNRRGDFRPTDLESVIFYSEKSELDSTGRKTPKIDGHSVLHNAAEAMYCSTPTRRPPHTITAGGSPEAMKRGASHSHRRSTGARRRSKEDTFKELQVPSVSAHGATINRMSYYNKAFPTDTTPPSYFCPAPNLKHRFDLDSGRGDQRSYHDCNTVLVRPHRDLFTPRTMPLRHYQYQPHSIDKAEI